MVLQGQDSAVLLAEPGRLDTRSHSRWTNSSIEQASLGIRGEAGSQPVVQPCPMLMLVIQTLDLPDAQASVSYLKYYQSCLLNIMWRRYLLQLSRQLATVQIPTVNLNILLVSSRYIPCIPEMLC